MTLSFYRTAASQGATSWMLILALVSATLFPQHYHMHHVDDSVLHESGVRIHVMDLHSHAQIDDISHEEDGHTVNTATDISLNTPGFQLPWVAILVTVLLLLPAPAAGGRQRPTPLLHQLPCFNRHKTPPLRAPPRV
jgi:hypothetical protein